MIEGAYKLLRVAKNASPEDVRNAYVRLVRRYPPEHFPEKFARLREAYQQLNLSDDFLKAVLKRMINCNKLIDMAACLWGDREELIYDKLFDPEELTALLEGEDTRHDLDELLASISDEIEWKEGDGQ